MNDPLGGDSGVFDPLGGDSGVLLLLLLMGLVGRKGLVDCWWLLLMLVVMVGGALLVPPLPGDGLPVTSQGLVLFRRLSRSGDGWPPRGLLRLSYPSNSYCVNVGMSPIPFSSLGSSLPFFLSLSPLDFLRLEKFLTF